jgi:hypothetical protein
MYNISMTKERSKLHPEQLKLFNSSIYRQKVKSVVERIKNYRGIPHGTKLPGKPNQLKPNASEKERDMAARVNNYRIDRASAHFWAQTIESSFERRSQAPAAPPDQE